jgi:hypothetical protein
LRIEVRSRTDGSCGSIGGGPELASEEPSIRGLEREERELCARIRRFSAGNRLSRDDVHRRDR